MSKSAVQMAMEAAKNAEKEKPVQTVSNAVPSTYVAPRQLGLDDIQLSSMQVDGYITLQPDGFKLKMQDPTLPKETGFVEKIHGVLKPNQDIMVFEGIRYGSNPTVYEKTFNMSVSAKGEPWVDCVRRAQQVDPKARPYTGADIAVSLLSDAKDHKGTVVAKVGQVVGQSTPYSGLKNLKAFKDEVQAAGLKDVDVEVIMTTETRTKAGVKDWAVTKFELVGEYILED